MEVVLQNLTKIFPSRDRKNREDVIAVSDFSFTIPDGELIGLLGPSGCGKSTTLNLISGLQKPTSGRIFFGEDDVTDLPPELCALSAFDGKAEYFVPFAEFEREGQAF